MDEDCVECSECKREVNVHDEPVFPVQKGIGDFLPQTFERIVTATVYLCGRCVFKDRIDKKKGWPTE